MVLRTDDVIRANSDTPGGAFTEIAGDVDVFNNYFTDGNPGVTDAFIRDSTDVGSANMWGEIVVKAWSSVNNFADVSVMTRVASAAVTGYAFGRFHDASVDRLSMYRWDSAVANALLLDAADTFSGVGEVLTLESLGRIHRCLKNGVEFGKIVDATYLTQQRHGASFYNQTSSLVTGGAPVSAGAFDNVPVFTNKTNGGSATDATSYATASVTIASGACVLLAIVHTHGSQVPKNADSVTGASITGATRIFSENFNSITVARSTLEVWAAVGTGVAGVITFNYGGGTSQTQTGATWSVDEVTNILTAQGTNGVLQFIGSAGDAVTNYTGGTLSAGKSAYNPVYAATALNINSALTSDPAFVKLADVGHTTPTERLETGYCSFFDPSWGSTGSSANYGVIRLELAANVGRDKLWVPQLLVAA